MDANFQYFLFNFLYPETKFAKLSNLMPCINKLYLYDLYLLLDWGSPGERHSPLSINIAHCTHSMHSLYTEMCHIDVKNHV